ncbi:MAG: SDR family oxidoreductase [Chloroflexi bacterium]|nr:MAG: SDR family oxidoreductase [Chloroflexota bacterium]
MAETSTTPKRCAASALPIAALAASSSRPRAVVSGGAGFIGSHLCRALLDQGMRVLAIDNFITGSPQNLKSLESNSDFEFRQADVNHGIFIGGDVRYVLHFASPASPPQYDSNPIHTLKVGTLGTTNMLGLARAKGATFLLASTSEVYGDPLVHPQPETYWGNVNPIGPRGCYDEAKRCAEAFAMAYHRTHQVDTRIVRIFNTHGPRMQVSDGRAVPNFMAQAIRGEPLTVYGDGSQTRSLCYVSDLVGGVLATLERGDELPINLGNPHEVTVLELAETIIRLAGSSSTIDHRELPVDDPKQRRPDIARAKKLLGWQPQVSLEDGLGRTLEYFRSVV